MLEAMSEAEEVFYKDIRQKKRTASGIHHKTGKRGYVGTMRFPTDYMSRREKYNYRKAGKIMTTNLFDIVLPIEEFKKLDDQEKRNRMQYWRSEKTNAEILKGLGISHNYYYKIVDELDLPKAPRTMKKEKANPKTKNPETPKVQEQTAAETPVQQMMFDGLHLAYQGTYRPEQIQKQLEKFQLLLEDEQDDFHVEIRLIQKEKSS